MNCIMKSKELKVCLWTSSFFTEPISFIAFSTVRHYITHFYNNEHIITSSLTSGATDMSICFFQRRSIKIIKAQERNCIECIERNCIAFLFIQPTNNFSLMQPFSICCFAYSLKCNNGQKKLSHITN